MPRCLAIINDNVQCKNTVKNDYCHCHKYSHGIYHNAEGWPTMSLVRRSMYNDVNNLSQLKFMIRRYLRQVQDTTISRRTHGLMVTESLIKYRIFFVDTPELELSINSIVDKMKKHEHLADYLEYFRRKVDNIYRLNARKRYIDYIISNSELGRDVSSVICSFL